MSSAPARPVPSLVAACIGAVVGFVVALLLHNYPKDVVTRHRYCLVCAEYEESHREGAILGAAHGEKHSFGGPVRNLLAPAVGEHEHRYTEWTTIHPTFGVPAEHPEIAERVRAIAEIESSPQLVSVLDQAMRNDRERTVSLLQRTIDPAVALPLSVIAQLDVDAPWPERWATVAPALGRAR